MTDLIPSDLSRLAVPELSSLRRRLQRQFGEVRNAKPIDVGLLEEIVSATKAVATEQTRRANEPPRVSARLVGFLPSWSPREKRPL